MKVFKICEKYTVELKNKEKTRICSYCGKPVEISHVLKNHEDETYIEYNCKCVDWNNNVDIKKEIQRYNFYKTIKELEDKYDSKKDGNKIEYEMRCLLKALIIYNKSNNESKTGVKKAESKKKKSLAIRVEHIGSGKAFPSIQSCARYYGVSANKIKNNKDNEFRFLK